MDDYDHEAFRELTPDEFYEGHDRLTVDVHKAADRMRVQNEARRVVAIERASAMWTPPESDGDLAAQLRSERTTLRHLVDKLMGGHHNVSLAGQFKTGKTTAGLNLAVSLVDGEDFLAHETHLPDGARVAWWNGEMEKDDWVDVLRPFNVQNPRDVEPLHLRGKRMPLLNDYVAEYVTKWLRENDIQVWCVDSWRRLCAWSGVNEIRNEEVEPLTDRIDQIKAES